MSGLIYMLGKDDELIAMKETPYANEDLLQGLLAKYPDLLAGDQIDPVTPRKWLLITRELPILPEEGGTGNMWLDHLFLDQDSVPTLIEVKRSSDTRLRREVVGQMLDYAANAVAYLSLETIQAKYTLTCEKLDLDPDQALMEFLGVDESTEEFWQHAKVNLQAGKIRLIFIADEIPFELRRIVEFLNEQMDPAEVLAVEVKQFVGSGIKTLVPRVIGQTTEAQQKKAAGGSGGRNWDEDSFFAELAAKKGSSEAKVAREILNWSKERVTRVWYGHGKLLGSFVPVLNHADRDHQLFAVWTNGYIEIYFYWYQYKAPFNTDAKRSELLSRLNAIDGITLPADSINKRPSIRLSGLEDSSRLHSMLNVFEWVVEEIKKT